MTRFKKAKISEDARNSAGVLRNRSPWRPCFNHFWRNTSGASTFVAVVAVPVLLLVLAGIIQFGALVYVSSQMTDVAREVAHRVAIGELTEIESETFARDSLINWGINYSVNTTVLPSPTADGGNDIVVDISAPMSEVAIIDVIGAFQDQILSTHVMMPSRL